MLAGTTCFWLPILFFGLLAVCTLFEVASDGAATVGRVALPFSRGGTATPEAVI